jgi:hypothetical protein
MCPDRHDASMCSGRTALAPLARASTPLQQIRLCNALSYHAGNIHTAYNITEEVACGKNPPLEYIVPGTIITAYTLPGSESISYACGLAECVPAGYAEPTRLMDKGWTWEGGWY